MKRLKKGSVHLLLFVIFAAMLSGCKKDEASIVKKDPLISWANPADIKFGTPLSATQLNATANVTGTFVYTPAIGTKLDAGANQILKVDFIPTDTKNYNVASKTVKINVTKDPVITWANPADIEVGTLLSATQLNAAADVAGTFVYTPPIGTKLNAGTNQVLKVDFTPTDAATYNAVSKTVKINVTEATVKDPIITWANPADITYDTRLSATQLNATADVEGSFVYNPPIGALLSVADNQDLHVEFIPADVKHYNHAWKTVKINVKKKSPTITWANPADISYGTKLSTTQLNATADVAGTFVYTPQIGTLLSVGDNQDLKVDFTPADETRYSITSKTVKINVKAATKKDPIITWANPLDINYGTKLSATQLNATADVAGSFAYTPSIGALLNVGDNQDLKVDFTPTDAIQYNIASKTVKINVKAVTKKDPIITWANPADITGGTRLSSTQLNATADVAGTFKYEPTIGDLLSVGANQSLYVYFTPTDAIHYNSVSKSVKINVKLDPIITWANPADINYGTALSATQLNATADVAGTFVYTPPIGTLLNSGANQVLKVEFTPTDRTLYNTTSKTVTINVIQTIGDGINFNPNLTYGTMTDQEGNTYKTITIGGQTWMAENLRVTKYRNGDPIPNVTNGKDWSYTSSGAYCWWNNDITKRLTYGALYNWLAATDQRNIAPVGWHVPTDDEWETLITYLGGESIAGDKLKEVGTTHWYIPNTCKDNASGFTALPGGYRDTKMEMFPNIRDSGYWWSATNADFYFQGTAWHRSMTHDSGGVVRYFISKSEGLSIRLVKD